MIYRLYVLDNFVNKTNDVTVTLGWQDSICASIGTLKCILRKTHLAFNFCVVLIIVPWMLYEKLESFFLDILKLFLENGNSYLEINFQHHYDVRVNQRRTVLLFFKFHWCLDTYTE